RMDFMRGGGESRTRTTHPLVMPGHDHKKTSTDNEAMVTPAARRFPPLRARDKRDLPFKRKWPERAPRPFQQSMALRLRLRFQPGVRLRPALAGGRHRGSAWPGRLQHRLAVRPL